MRSNSKSEKVWARILSMQRHKDFFRIIYWDNYWYCTFHIFNIIPVGGNYMCRLVNTHLRSVVFRQFLLTVFTCFRQACNGHHFIVWKGVFWKANKRVLQAEKMPFETVIITVPSKIIPPTGNKNNLSFYYLPSKPFRIAINPSWKYPSYKPCLSRHPSNYHIYWQWWHDSAAWRYWGRSLPCCRRTCCRPQASVRR